MAGTFELKRSGTQFFFHLKAANGEIVLTSERYTEKENAHKGIASVKANAPNDAHYKREIAANGQHYFVLKAANGEVIGTSETYSSKEAMEKGIAAVKVDCRLQSGYAPLSLSHGVRIIVMCCTPERRNGPACSSGGKGWTTNRVS